MKKTLYFSLLIIIISLSNCKYFKRNKVEPVKIVTDTIVADTLPYLGENIYWLQEVNDKYMIVVGSFETLKFAKIHQKKYAQLGLDTKVIVKPDGFYMVTGKSFDTYEAAHAELPKFRRRIAKKSWVFINYRVLDQASLY